MPGPPFAPVVLAVTALKSTVGSMLPRDPRAVAGPIRYPIWSLSDGPACKLCNRDSALSWECGLPLLAQVLCMMYHTACGLPHTCSAPHLRYSTTCIPPRVAHEPNALSNSNMRRRRARSHRLATVRQRTVPSRRVVSQARYLPR